MCEGVTQLLDVLKTLMPYMATFIAAHCQEKLNVIYPTSVLKIQFSSLSMFIVIGLFMDTFYLQFSCDCIC